ncbi:DUF1302 family protein [Noviherbaspirillum sedimenti]|uniref:DUF1302 family protein n=1 Tax=Noviherbaspirillum sedimenti TaxID=2320865 RepID=UPI002368AF29|nr:DUF1302 family protein [Noviherbaspirillum sedimenti]
MIGLDAAGNTNYHLAYADKVRMVGLSYDAAIGPFSTGFEASYRRNTALASSTGPVAGDLAGREGARGDTLHLIANVQKGLTPTSFYDAGFAIAELAYTKRLKTRSKAEMYAGVNNAAACPGGDKWTGCATDDSASIALYVAPQWLQVMPGVDLDMPMYAQYGLYGNSATAAGGNNQGSLLYTLGLHALVQQKYHVTLQYNGFHGHHSGGLTSGPAGNFYTAGNGLSFLNDRNWVSLTFSTAF